MKSFLALERPATFTCRKNGIERKYLVFEGQEFVNYDLIFEGPTSEENGVRAEIVIKNSNEYNQFLSKAKQKLAYYDTAVIDNCGTVIDSNIIRSEEWQWSSLNSHSYIHIALKDVYYEIDWSALGIQPIHMPIALRFSLQDGLVPTPSRESYITNEKIKGLILEKLKTVATWFFSKMNENQAEYTNLIEAYDAMAEEPWVKVAERKFSIGCLEDYSSIKRGSIVIPGMELMTTHWYFKNYDELLSGWHQVGELYDDRFRNDSYSGGYTMMRRQIEKKRTQIRVYSKPVGNVREYLKSKYNKSYHYTDFYTVNTRRTLGQYKSLLNLHKKPKDQWRAIIAEFQKVEQSIIDLLIVEKDVENSQEFIDWIKERNAARKANMIRTGTYKGLNKQEGDITISEARKHLKTGVTVFDKKTMKISILHKIPALNVYLVDGGLDYIDNEELMSTLYQMVCNINQIDALLPIRFYLIGKREVNKLPKIHNFMSLQEFMSGKSMPFRRIATACKIEILLRQYKDIMKEEEVHPYVKNVTENVRKLKEYVNTQGKVFDAHGTDAILAISEEKNLWDFNIYSVYLETAKKLEELDFVSVLDTPRLTEEIKLKSRVISELLLFRKKYKGMFDNYELVEKQPEEIAETTTEATVGQELVDFPF